MMTKTNSSKPVQSELFKVLLRDLVAPGHELVLLRDAIDWKRFDETMKEAYCENNGRPSVPVRMMAGLTFLKYMYDISDQDVLNNWCENPYPPSASESRDSPVAQRSGCPTSNARSLAQQGRKRSSDVNQGCVQPPVAHGRGAISSLQYPFQAQESTAPVFL
jgi:IS5 family transposase